MDPLHEGNFIMFYLHMLSLSFYVIELILLRPLKIFLREKVVRKKLSRSSVVAGPGNFWRIFKTLYLNYPTQPTRERFI